MTNRNAILAALPFAAFTDAAFIAKVFFNYSDPTLTYVAIGSLVIVALLVLKAFDLLKMPTFTASHSHDDVREIHHHHYHEDESSCDCEDEDDEDDEDAYDRGYEDGKEENMNDNGNYDEGYNDGYDKGHDKGYEARKSEEEHNEAQALAKYIIAALKLEKDQTTSPIPPAEATPTPTEAPKV